MADMKLDTESFQKMGGADNNNANEGTAFAKENGDAELSHVDRIDQHAAGAGEQLRRRDHHCVV